MIYYKVVAHNDQNQLLSATLTGSAWAEKGKLFAQLYRTTYQLNEWTKPPRPKSKLFVFNDLELAQQFRNKNEPFIEVPLEIYECEVTNPVPIKEIAYLMKDFDIFWKNYRPLSNWERRIPTCKTPAGSHHANEVKLLRLVS